MSNGIWSIESQCPQCGSPVSTEETDHIFTCTFCRVRLYMSLPPGEYFRYYIPAKDPGQKVFYVPYWRFRGTLFSCPIPDRSNEILEPARYEVTTRLIDSSTLAIADPRFPATLGLRPQVLKLRFVVPGVNAQFLPHTLEQKQAVERISSTLNHADGSAVAFKPFYDEFIGESISIIYAPFCIKFDSVFDGVTNSPVCRVTDAEAKALLSGESYEGLKPAYLPTLCGHCGDDLSGDPKTLILNCTNCDKAWLGASTELIETPYSSIAARENGNSWLPFWKMKAEIDGLNLKTHADLIRAANLPRLIPDEYNEKEAFFWSPAFKISPPLFLRLAQRLTMIQPDETLFEANGHMKAVYPVTLPLSEATEAIILNVAGFSCKKNDLYPRLRKLKVKLVSSELKYISFTNSGMELVQAGLGISINKTAADMGVNL